MTDAGKDRPEWLALFCTGAPAKAVAEAWWWNGISDEDREHFSSSNDNKVMAAQKLRRAIVDSQLPEVRADASNSWKYTGSIMRAADEVMGMPRPSPQRASPSAPKADGQARVAAADAPAAGGAEAAADASAAAAADDVPAPPAIDGKSVAAQARPKLMAEGDGSPGTLGLYWSDFKHASDSATLRSKYGVTHRLNVARECEGKLPSDDANPLETVDVPMEDVFTDDEDVREMWANQLRHILSILRGWRETGAVVNINCQMGKNRSGAAVLVWMCSECGWNLTDAVEHMRRINLLACANPHLLIALGDVLSVDGRQDLNPAHDGGGWVFISPPGSPRAGAGAGGPGYDVENLLAKASQELEEKKIGGDTVPEEEEDEECDVPPIFGELSDVD
eukprot:TRINITY_DN46624_c1_g1_i1.p1 TRINITY_DN46624_c1_g1~~TRINITY_DN46624_c1_g1_i1.p1  ORF type:complete len:412 (+),score=96.23 TRINITY_DN46624_c1_g1_i1:61-1236(+)